MKEVLSAAVFLCQAGMLSVALYQLMIALWGLARLPCERRRRESKPSVHFLCLTFAHNEEAVIEAHVKNVLAMKYPRWLFDVVVVADNCSDDTAKTALAAGATVWSRHDPSRRGKGHAMRWALYERANINAYDAVCIFDADNLVEPNFLAQMCRHICEGHAVIQAYLDTKNPWDSWVSASYALAYWYMNRFWQRPRIRLGLSGALGGTGFCVTTRQLQSLVWQTNSLTEDLEYSTEVVRNGGQVYWTPDTRVYDEKPVRFRQTFSQRKRWLQGHWSAALGQTAPLLRTVLAAGSLHQRLRAFDFLVYLWQPLVILFTGANLLLLPINLACHDWHFPWLAQVLPSSIWGGIAILGMLLPVVAFALEDADWRSFLYYPVFLLFNLTWIPIAVVGLWRHRDSVWSHTQHTCNLQYQDLASRRTG